MHTQVPSNGHKSSCLCFLFSRNCSHMCDGDAVIQPWGSQVPAKRNGDNAERGKVVGRWNDWKKRQTRLRGVNPQCVGLRVSVSVREFSSAASIESPKKIDCRPKIICPRHFKPTFPRFYRLPGISSYTFALPVAITSPLSTKYL